MSPLLPKPSTPRRAIASAVILGAALVCWLLAAPAGAQDPPGTTTYLGFGDSLTFGFGDEDVDCVTGPKGGYPTRLRQALNGLGYTTAVWNYGVCGEETSTGLSRIDEEIARGGDVVILLEGSNDLSKPNSISVESIVRNLESMIDKIQTAGLVAIVVAPPPRDPEAGQSNARTARVSLLLEGIAAEKGAIFVPLYDQFLGVADLFDSYYADPLHPNARGYDLMTNFLRDPAIQALERSMQPPGPCTVSDRRLCLNGGRFGVEVAWERPDGTRGLGTAVPLTADTGFFYFFNPSNIELVLKVLDGRPINEAFWVYYGALSDVEYTITVTDSVDGTVQQYVNPQGNLASVGDTNAFPQSASASVDGSASAFGGALALGPHVEPVAGERRQKSAEVVEALKDSCDDPTPEVLCLNGDRFAIEVAWETDADTGVGTAVELTEDSGYFWFFRDTNVELVLKVLDGRPINGNFWVYYGALSDVAYTIEATDLETGAAVTYVNSPGAFRSLADVSAFPAP